MNKLTLGVFGAMFVLFAMSTVSADTCYYTKGENWPGVTNCGYCGDNALLDYINLWSQGKISDIALLDAIYHWSNADPVCSNCGPSLPFFSSGTLCACNQDLFTYVMVIITLDPHTFWVTNCECQVPYGCS